MLLSTSYVRISRRGRFEKYRGFLSIFVIFVLANNMRGEKVAGLQHPTSHRALASPDNQ
jgi:hypothetical protein